MYTSQPLSRETSDSENMGAQRARFAGDPRQLATLVGDLMPFPAAIRYVDVGSTLNKQMLTREPLRSILKKLQTVQENLSYNKKTMEQAMKIIGQTKFKLQGDELKDFYQRSAARLRTACRHAAQGLLRSPSTTWVRDIFGTTEAQSEEKVQQEGDEQAGDEEAEEEEKEHDIVEDLDTTKNVPVRKPSFTYGFDAATMSVWRSSSSTAAKEVTYDIYTEVKDPPTSGVWVKFHDGKATQVPPDIITKERYNKIRNQKKRGQSQGLHWEGMHVDTGDRVWVARRKDRNGIVVLLQGDAGRMVCMCSIKKFEYTTEEDNYQAALAFMEKLGRGYISGDIKADEIYAIRDKELKVMGCGTKRSVSKRPARRTPEAPPPPCEHPDDATEEKEEKQETEKQETQTKPVKVVKRRRVQETRPRPDLEMSEPVEPPSACDSEPAPSPDAYAFFDSPGL